LETVSSSQIRETRKLQITGGSTFIISLPKQWVVQNQLKKGSFLQIREDNGALSILPTNIVPRQRSEQAVIKVLPKDDPHDVIRRTVATYLVGYNSILIRSPKQQLSPLQRSKLKTFARNLLVGTEIVTDTPSELTLQVLLNYPELSIQSALRRMCIITGSMHTDAMAALKTCDHQTAESVIATDNEVDRFNLYIVRQLKMAIQNPRIIQDIGLGNARDCLGYRLVTKSVERMADHAVNIAKNTLILKHCIPNETFTMLEKMSVTAINLFNQAIDALFRKNYASAENVLEQTQNITGFDDTLVKSPVTDAGNETASLRLIGESVRRTAEYASDIAEIVLNLTIESII
jgi:phosphate uptake regulator